MSKIILFVGIDTLFGAMPRKIVGFSKEAEKGFRYMIDLETSALTIEQPQLLEDKTKAKLNRAIEIKPINGCKVQ